MSPYRKFVLLHTPGGTPVGGALEVSASQFGWLYLEKMSPLLREEAGLSPWRWGLGLGCSDSTSLPEHWDLEVWKTSSSLLQCKSKTTTKCLTVLLPWLHMVEQFGEQTKLFQKGAKFDQTSPRITMLTVSGNRPRPRIDFVCFNVLSCAVLPVSRLPLLHVIALWLLLFGVVSFCHNSDWASWWLMLLSSSWLSAPMNRYI